MDTHSTLDVPATFTPSHANTAASVESSNAARIAIFCAVVAIAMVAADAVIDFGLRTIETGAYGVFNRIVDGRINARILVSGSSRALNHYDPRLLERVTGASAWNIGVNGSQTDMQLAVLRTYLRHNRSPDLLIHNLDSFTFVTSRGGLTFPEQYVPYLDESPLYEALRSLDDSWWKARYLPLYGYAVHDMRFGWLQGVRALVGAQPAEVRFQGFEPRFTAWTGDFERFREANPDGVAFDVEAEGVRDLEELISEASRSGARVLLVYSPVYHEMQQLERGRSELFARFQAIAGRHGAALWDYSESPISQRRAYFYNSQHLNADGAKAFSQLLADRLASSGLLERRSTSRTTPQHGGSQ